MKQLNPKNKLIRISGDYFGNNSNNAKYVTSNDHYYYDHKYGACYAIHFLNPFVNSIT